MTWLTALSRYLRLRLLRQEVARIETFIEGLEPVQRRTLAEIVRRDLGLSSAAQFPHLYSTPPNARYLPWGSGSEVAMRWLESDQNLMQMKGAGLWLAVVHQELVDSPHAALQAVHRRVLRLIRLLRESRYPQASGSKPDAMDDWFAAA
jgi:hypothetical protein